ncbi:MAG: hypothetical protein AAGU15_04310 [Anaerolineaceae bacterium]
MKRMSRFTSFWVSGLTVLLVFFLVGNSSPGSGMATYWRYFPLIVKNAPLKIPVGPVGGTFTALVVDPNQNRTLYAGSYVSGVYKTYDQGDNWYQQNIGLGNLKIQSLAIHPKISNIVYAGTYNGGIYKSINGGESWQASNGGVLGNHVVYDIEIDPNNPTVIYAATRINYAAGDPNNLRGYLYKSTNAGASWTLLITGDAFSTLDYFYDIDVNPLNSNELYLTAHEHGFYKSTNGGTKFFPVNNGVNDLSARSFALDVTIPGRVYGGVWHTDGVYRTTNSGSSWEKRRTGLPVNTAVFRLYTNLYGGSPRRIFACTYGNGLFSTDDAAQNWISRGLAGERLYDFLVANGTPQRWFAATESHGVFRADAGSTWWKGIMGDLRLNAVTGIVKDEPNGKIYASVYGLGVYSVSADGLQWEELSQDLADKTVIDLAIYEEKLHILTETGLYFLDDQGWTQVGLPAGKVNASALMFVSEKIGLPGEALADHLEQTQLVSNSPGNMVTSVLGTRLFAEDNNLYLGTVGSGLFMRVAKNWVQVGLEGLSVFDVAIKSGTDDVYVVACETTNSCQVYQSQDEGWLSLQSDSSDSSVNRLLFTQKGLLAATDSGLFVLDPEGEQWKLLAGEGKEVLSITSDNGCDLAAAGLGLVLISHDCAASWQELPLEEWHYQTLSFLGSDANLLLIGSQETGAAVLPIK